MPDEHATHQLLSLVDVVVVVVIVVTATLPLRSLLLPSIA